MIVTEEEAKTKRCQESYPAAEGLSLHGFIESAPVPTGAASISSSSYARHTAPINCIGRACMGWRWWMESGTTRKRMPSEYGYCGKAGKP